MRFALKKAFSAVHPRCPLSAQSFYPRFPAACFACFKHKKEPLIHINIQEYLYYVMYSECLLMSNILFPKMIIAPCTENVNIYMLIYLTQLSAKWNLTLQSGFAFAIHPLYTQLITHLRCFKHNFTSINKISPFHFLQFL